MGGRRPRKQPKRACARVPWPGSGDGSQTTTALVLVGGAGGSAFERHPQPEWSASRGTDADANGDVLGGGEGAGGARAGREGVLTAKRVHVAPLVVRSRDAGLRGEVAERSHTARVQRVDRLGGLPIPVVRTRRAR